LAPRWLRVVPLAAHGRGTYIASPRTSIGTALARQAEEPHLRSHLQVPAPATWILGAYTPALQITRSSGDIASRHADVWHRTEARDKTKRTVEREQRLPLDSTVPSTGFLPARAHGRSACKHDGTRSHAKRAANSTRPCSRFTGDWLWLFW